MKYSVSNGFPYYIECLGNKDFKELILSKENRRLLHSISEEQSTYRYVPDKWSIKQIIRSLVIQPTTNGS